MSWKDLFKSKAPKGKPDPRIRWFGKLPTYADYYTSAADEEWAVEFNDWILKGFEMRLSRQGKGTRDGRMPSAACILRLPKSSTTVFASIQDYGGDMRGRPFPLCLYVGVPSQLWPGPTSDRALAGLRVLGDLTELREEVFRFFNAPGRFETVFGGRELDLTGVDEETSDDSWVSTAGELSLADWFEAAKPSLKVDDVDRWFRLASAWGENISTLESEEFAPTFRFPLVMAVSFDVQVAGWLRWLEGRMNLRERFLSVMVCKDPGDGTGHLSVIAREIVPEDFLLMTPLANSLSYVDDLCLLGGEHETAQGSNGDEGTDVGVRAPASWVDFVRFPVAT